MTQLSFRPRGSLKTQVDAALWGRVRLSAFMEAPEEEFRQVLERIESDPLFKRLASFENVRERVVSRKPFPNTSLASCFYEVDERTMSAGAETAPLIEKHQEMFSLIKGIGTENFQKYFLYGQEELDAEKIARICGVSPCDVREIQKVVDDFSLLELASPASALPAPSASAPRGTKIASIERNPGGGSDSAAYKVVYHAAYYARGRYAVNYKKLYELKAAKAFSRGEFARIKRLLRQIELVNTRQTILWKIVKTITRAQTAYFDTREVEKLNPLTQQELAKRLAVHRSTVNRAIKDKYLQTPWGEDRSLRSFLKNKKWFAKRTLSRAMEESGTKVSDETLRQVLLDRYGLRLARRTVCAYRHELGMSPGG